MSAALPIERRDEVDRFDLQSSAIEKSFPVVEVSVIAERESWRKELNRPLYHIHKWWATRLGSVFRAIVLGSLLPPDRDIWSEFYKAHNLSGKIVLDPFMGSGTTLGEALKLGCSVVGCDVNPISTFLVRQALTRVPEDELRNAFRKLECEIAPEIRSYYRTKDPLTGEQIPVLYFFWVKEVVTPSGEHVPLFDNYVFSRDAYPKKKPKAQIVCPSCWGIFEDRYDSELCRCPGCRHEFNPQRGPAKGQHIRSSTGDEYRIKDLLDTDKPPKHRMYAVLAVRPDGRKVYLRTTADDLNLFRDAEVRLAKEELPLPEMPVRAGHNTDQARGYNYRHWREFFNARQLLCLGLLLKAILRIDNQSIREQLLCLFSSALEFNNLFCSFKGEGTGAVRHMFSNHILKPERAPLENSVWGGDRSSGTFASLFESRLIRAKRYLDEPFEVMVDQDLLGAPGATTKTITRGPIDIPMVNDWRSLRAQTQAALILNGDSAALPIPNESVDAVVTDPPYFDYVHYSELSDFFYAWLAPVLQGNYEWFRHQCSANPGEVQQKDPRAFARQLGRVFLEATRVLKPHGVLAFSFHHARPEGWAAIYESLAVGGLKVVAVHPVHAELRAASPKTAAKTPISLDAILVCKKSNEVTNPLPEESVVGTARNTGEMLESAGLHLSDNDYFVIAAAYALIALGPECLTFDDVRVRLERTKESMERELRASQGRFDATESLC